MLLDSPKPTPEDAPMTGSPYEMTVNLNVLDHLGINLYSNVAAVLTEAVANAWDADATEVRISYDDVAGEIIIADDGCGMTIGEMNEKFLKVGYRRRDNESAKTVRYGRSVMGRKGLGKLSLFSIADRIRVESSKEGQPHGLIMAVPDIRSAIVEQNTKYIPGAIPSGELVVANGTRIKLSSLKRSRIPSSFSALRKKIARRFSVIGGNFKVYINDHEVGPADRDDLKALEYLWHIGEQDPERQDAAKQLKEETTLPDRLDGWDSAWRVKGWLGTACKPKDLAKDGANLNSIVLLARGRLIQENMLDSINDGRLYTKYLTGQLEADFLDLDDRDDIATSDRQRVVEDDPRTLAVHAYLKSMLSKLEPQWSKWRKEHSAQEIAQEHPAVREWFDSLDGAYADQARTLIAKIGSLPIDDKEDRKALLRSGILAFERLKLRGSAAELAEAVEFGAERLVPLIEHRDAFEAALYRDIVKSRLDVIHALRRLVDEDEKEKALQKHLFDHLWLIDSTWERADGSELIESRLLEEGVKVHDLTEKERLGRVDIKYRNVMGKHVIVELKRAGRNVKLIELQEQGILYVDKLEKILGKQGEQNPQIEVVFVIGPMIDEEKNNRQRVESMMDAVSPGSRIVHFDNLISGATRHYQQFLDKSAELDRVASIVDRI